MPRQLLTEEEKKARRNERVKRHYAANRERILEYQRQNRIDNADQKKAYHADYRAKNKELLRTKKKAYRDANKAKVAEAYKRWREENRETWLDGKRAYYSRAKESKVEWDKELTELVMVEGGDLCRRMEKLTGVKYHVDHIIPLKGKTVCGLHVWNNLRVIPASVNIAKNNKFDESLLG